MLALRIPAALAVFTMLVLFGANTNAAETIVPERSIGSPKAPVTMQEYVSFTCSHCATFHNETLPELKKRYVDTGKLRIILRDFPLDGNALKGAALARCMPEEQFFSFVSVLFKNMTQWAIGANTDQTLIQYARLGGLSEEKAKACLADTKLLDAIVAERTEGNKKYDIQATPTFILNDGAEKITGGRSLDDFTSAIDRLLAAKK